MVFLMNFEKNQKKMKDICGGSFQTKNGGSEALWDARKISLPVG